MARTPAPDLQIPRPGRAARVPPAAGAERRASGLQRRLR